MARAWSWPNLITVARAGLIVVVVLLAYGHDWWSRALAAAVALTIIIGDWLDGHLARKLNQSSTLGRRSRSCTGASITAGGTSGRPCTMRGMWIRGWRTPMSCRNSRCSPKCSP